MPNGFYDITEFGGVAGSNCDTAAEAAYQAAVAYNEPSVIHFGAGEWTFGRPLVADLTALSITGVGRGATTLKTTGAFCPVLLGIRRNAAGNTLAAGHRPDAFGKVSFATAGQYAGYRTMGNAHLGFWSSPFDKGRSDGWKTPTKITVSWMYEGGIIKFGMQATGDKPNPWFFMANDASTYAFKFRTADKVQRSCSFPVAGDPVGLHRCALQIDLDAGSWQAYVDGFQRGAGTFPAGLAFLPTHDTVFGVGQLGTHLAMNVGTEDRTIYALRVSNGLLYHNDGVPQPLRRLDGANQTDGHYYASEPDLMACLMVTLPHYSGSRLVHYKVGEGAGEYVNNGYGLFLHSGVQGGGINNPERQCVRDMTITQNFARWGQALTVGGVLGLEVRNVKLIGGWQGLGSAPLGACWPTTLVDVITEGYDAGLALSVHTIFGDRIDCGWAGTAAMRLDGCSGTLRNIWINGQTQGRSEITIDIIGRDDASYLMLDGVRCNQEGYPEPTIAAIRAIPGGDFPLVPMRLKLSDISWGNVGPDASLVRLEEGDPPYNVRKCHFELDWAYTEGSEIGVVTTGPRWEGTVDPGPHGDKTWLVHDGPGESGLILIGDGGGGATSMASLMYNSAIVKLQDGTIDLNTDTIGAMLVTSAYVPDKDAHATRADVTGEVTGTGYTAGGKPLANKSVTQDNANNRGKFDADDVVWTAATLTARGAVLYKSRGGAANLDELIDYLDFGADISSANGPFTLEFHGDGIHYIG